VPGQANFVMFHLEPDQPPAATVLSEARRRGIFLRDASLMGSEVGPRALRLTVKDEEANERIVATLESVLSVRSSHSPDWQSRGWWQCSYTPETSSEFQKILEHRGIVATDPVGALAHLQSGRAFVLSGDKAKLKTAYQDFLTLWKDADPDIPLYQQAKAEYAKLQ
jgi:hypothetical protein